MSPAMKRHLLNLPDMRGYAVLQADGQVFRCARHRLKFAVLASAQDPYLAHLLQRQRKRSTYRSRANISISFIGLPFISLF